MRETPSRIDSGLPLVFSNGKFAEWNHLFQYLKCQLVGGCSGSRAQAANQSGTPILFVVTFRFHLGIQLDDSSMGLVDV
jgi:hypothetical protein